MRRVRPGLITAVRVSYSTSTNSPRGGPVASRNVVDPQENRIGALRPAFTYLNSPESRLSTMNTAVAKRSLGGDQLRYMLIGLRKASGADSQLPLLRTKAGIFVA